MLTVTVDIQDRPINGQTENFRHVELVQDGILKVHLKFSDKKADLKDHKTFLFNLKTAGGGYRGVNLTPPLWFFKKRIF